MNKVTTLNLIAEKLAAKANISTEEATRFVSAYFASAETLLSKGRSVSIDGLGTFSTSGGIVTFTPDPALAELLNEPFAMFSSVPLDDDFDFSLIEEEEASASTEENKETEKVTQETVEAETVSEEAVETETVSDETVVPKTSTGEPAPVEDNRRRVGPPPFSRERFSALSAEISEAKPSVNEMPEVNVKLSGNIYVSSADEETESKNTAKNYVIRIIIVAVISLILGICIGYCARDSISGFIGTDSNVTEQITEK